MTIAKFDGISVGACPKCGGKSLRINMDASTLVVQCNACGHVETLDRKAKAPPAVTDGAE